MKYSVASGECGSPKSPTVVVFPTFFRRTEPLNSQTDLKTHEMTSPVQACGGGGGGPDGMPSENSSYIRVDSQPNIFHNVPSTAQLLPQPAFPQSLDFPTQHRPIRPNRYQDTYKNSDTLLDIRDNSDRRSSGHYSYKSNKECTMKYSSLFICVFIILFVIIITGVIGYLFYTVFNLQTKCQTLEQRLSNAQTSQALKQDDPRLCLPCEDLSLGPFDEDTPGLKELLRHKDNEGGEVCCARTTAQVSVLLNLFAKRKHLEKCAQELLKETNKTSPCNQTGISGAQPPRPESTPISAHLFAGTQFPLDVSSHEYQPIRNWQVEKPGAHLKGIQLHDDRLVVPETGVYFLYSQVGFFVYYEEGQEVDPNGAQSLFHTVFRYNLIYPQEQKLLRSGVTQCWERQKDYGRYTSYVGAAVELNKGDKIYVKVSKIHFLAKNEPETTYFGMYKLT